MTENSSALPFLGVFGRACLILLDDYAVAVLLARLSWDLDACLAPNWHMPGGCKLSDSLDTSFWIGATSRTPSTNQQIASRASLVVSDVLSAKPLVQQYPIGLFVTPGGDGRRRVADALDGAARSDFERAASPAA